MIKIIDEEVFGGSLQNTHGCFFEGNTTLFGLVFNHFYMYGYLPIQREFDTDFENADVDLVLSRYIGMSNAEIFEKIGGFKNG